MIGQDSRKDLGSNQNFIESNTQNKKLYVNQISQSNEQENKIGQQVNRSSRSVLEFSQFENPQKTIQIKELQSQIQKSRINDNTYEKSVDMLDQDKGGISSPSIIQNTKKYNQIKNQIYAQEYQNNYNEDVSVSYQNKLKEYMKEDQILNFSDQTNINRKSFRDQKESFGNFLNQKSKEQDSKNKKLKDKMNSVQRSALPATGQISLQATKTAIDALMNTYHESQTQANKSGNSALASIITQKFNPNKKNRKQISLFTAENPQTNASNGNYFQQNLLNTFQIDKYNFRNISGAVQMQDLSQSKSLSSALLNHKIQSTQKNWNLNAFSDKRTPGTTFSNGNPNPQSFQNQMNFISKKRKKVHEAILQQAINGYELNSSSGTLSTSFKLNVQKHQKRKKSTQLSKVSEAYIQNEDYPSALKQNKNLDNMNLPTKNNDTAIYQISPFSKPNKPNFLKNNLNIQYLKISDFIIKTNNIQKQKLKAAQMMSSSADKNLPSHQQIYSNIKQGNGVHQNLNYNGAVQSQLKQNHSNYNNSHIQNHMNGSSQAALGRGSSFQAPNYILNAGQTQIKKVFNQPYLKFQIFPGNNSQLVAKVFMQGCPKRAQMWYEMANKQQSHYHFRWTPTSKNINFERLSYNFTQAANHFEGHSELSRKHELFRNIRSYLDQQYIKYKNQIDGNHQNIPYMFSVMPIQFHIKLSLPNNQSNSMAPLSGFGGMSSFQNHAFDHRTDKMLKVILKQQMDDFKKVYNLIDQFNKSDQSPSNNQLRIFITEKAQQNGYNQIEQTIKKFSKKFKDSTSPINPITELSQLIFKGKMQKNFEESKILQVKSFSKTQGNTPICDFLMPQSHYARKVFINKTENKKQTLDDQSVQSKLQNNYLLEKKNLWILKPVGLNRGQGIHIVDSIKKCKKLMKEYFYGREYVVGGHNAIQTLNEDETCASPIGYINTKKLRSAAEVHSNQAKVDGMTEDSSQSDMQEDQSNTKFIGKNQAENGLDAKVNSFDENQQYKAPHYYDGSPTKSKKNFVQNSGSSQYIKCSQFIIQKYIEDPLLINDRKFDIRVWVLITQNSDCFFFREGYIRTSSSKYTTDSNALENEWVHLTNNAIQKHSPNYGDFEDGNQMSFQDFRRYLRDKHGKPDNFFNQVILQKIKNYTQLSLEAVKKKLNPNKRSNCFELLGYDYIIDAEFNTWLIEANTNPCLEESSNLLKMLIPRMLNDAFKLTVDKIFKTSHCEIKYQNEQEYQPYPVIGYSDSQNMWQLICSFGPHQNTTPQIDNDYDFQIKSQLKSGLNYAYSNQDTAIQSQRQSFGLDQSILKNKNISKQQDLRQSSYYHQMNGQMIVGSAVNPNFNQGGYSITNFKKDFTKETEAVIHLLNPYEIRLIS